MFRDALKLAHGFTFPIIISRLNWNGNCEGGIGAFIPINRQGWCVTAGHIVQEFLRFAGQENQSQAHEAEKAKIEADVSLTPKERSRKLKALGRPSPDSIRRCSAWLFADGTRMADVTINNYIDLAVFRLDPFDANSVRNFPIFKNPSVRFETGASLCRLGFPFNVINPVWDGVKQAFSLPSGIPPTFFPNEGIYTRDNIIQLDPAPQNPPPYQLMFLETSSAGLRGQSGGPIFDVHGNVWAVQSNTMSLPLGFEVKIAANGRTVTEHQVMNVGRGVHVQTIIGMLTDLKITFDTSVD